MSTLEGFTHRQTKEIKELGLSTHLYKHDQSGVDYLHIASNDTNNACNIIVRTFADNDRGIPHVLEHIALCGSKKYPVRDPFFKMLTRSQQTFMNALTSSNATMYLYATQNPTDFKNLFDMYFESVYHCLLSKSSYWQEGFRLEFSDKNDKNSEILPKGVVFNEMKGVFSSMDSFYSYHMINKLMPTNAYRFESGGLPLNIMDLTHEDLLNFYKKFYHPSNSIIVTYGDIPLETQAEMINEKLKIFKSANLTHSVTSVERWSEPKKVTVFAAPDPLAVDPKKTTAVSHNYLLTDAADVYENFCLQILSNLLVDGPCSSLYQALITPQIGSDFSWETGFTADLKDTFFSVGLQGLAEEDVEKVEKIIDDTFEGLSREGFSDDRIESVLHSIELKSKYRSKNFGIDLTYKLGTGWALRTDFVGSLEIENLVGKFRADLADSNFLKNLIKKYFIENTHKLVLVSKVDQKVPEMEKQLEKNKLDSMVANCDKNEVFKIGHQLDEESAQFEDLSILPCLSVNDIDASVTRENISVTSMDGVDVFSCVTSTNDLVYFKILFGCNHLDQEEIKYLPLLCYVMTQMGTKQMDYKEQSNKISQVSSTFDAAINLVPSPLSTSSDHISVQLGNYCLDHNFEKCLDLWAQIIKELTLDDGDRLALLIKTSATEMAESIPYSGHRYARRVASSLVHPITYKNELIYGLSQASLMKSLSEQEDKQEIVAKLQNLVAKVFGQRDCRMLLTTMNDKKDNCMFLADSFLSKISVSDSTKSDFFTDFSTDMDPGRPRKIHYEFPFNVSYVAKSVHVPILYSNTTSATFEVLSELMSWKYLHIEIREKGGAYGAGAVFSYPTYSFYSYRDPFQLETLDIYEKAVDWVLEEGSFSQQDIDEAKLMVFQRLDSPLTPSTRGLDLFHRDIDDDMVQLHRDSVFAVTKEDLVECAKKYLKNAENVGYCIIGPKNEKINQDQSWVVNKF